MGRELGDGRGGGILTGLPFCFAFVGGGNQVWLHFNARLFGEVLLRPWATTFGQTAGQPTTSRTAEKDEAEKLKGRKREAERPLGRRAEGPIPWPILWPRPALHVSASKELAVQ